MYWHVALFRAKQFMAYPLDVYANIFRTALDIGLLVAFWTIVGNSGGGTVDTRALIVYFLTAEFVAGISMFYNLRLTSEVSDLIRTGRISAYMLKPLRLVPYLYADIYGRRAVELSISAVVLCIGLVLLPPAAAGIILFLAFLACAFGIALGVNLLVASLAFYTVEASSLRWSIYIALRFVSGVMVPISFFPGILRDIALLSPFPGLVYGPVAALRATAFTPEILTQLGVNAFWAIAVPLLAFPVWSHSMRKYEATGG